MAVTALEISLNGKVLYVVGAEGWHSLGASIYGLRHTREMLQQITQQVLAQTGEVPEGFDLQEMETLFFSAHVGLPDPDGSGSSSGRGYGQETLSIGDEVTIRVIETDSPDPPQPPLPDDGCNLRISTLSGDDGD